MQKQVVRPDNAKGSDKPQPQDNGNNGNGKVKGKGHDKGGK